MTPVRAPAPASRVLVVDDDRRVRELIEIALTAHGFAVITAADGEEALQRAQAERPDLVVLDIRLPKRNGFEVCDLLRNDPADPSVPIILVSAAAEADQRLLAFTRGADDYLAKPFSPKELVARVRRLLARAAEARVAVRHAQELERELASARREAHRADEEARREHHLRALASGPALELFRGLDLDAIANRLLWAAQSRTGPGAVALLLPSGAGGWLTPWAVRGDRFERAAGLALPAGGELATLMSGLRRPAARAELERLVDAREEIAPLVTGRWALVAPLCGATGLEGLLVAEERADGADFTRADGEWLATLCDFAAAAVRNAAQARAQAGQLIEAAAERFYRPPRTEEALAGALALLDRCLAGTGLPPRWRDLIAHALAFAGVTEGREDRAALERLRAHDASGLVRAIESLLERAHAPEPPSDDACGDQRPVVLLRALLACVRARARGAEPDLARSRALEVAADDPVIARAFTAAAPEGARREDDAA